jgi:hypothetical protein
MWLALAFAGQGCDKFFDVRGVLLDCGTTGGISGAQGVATADGYSEPTRVTTDSAGAFHIHMNAPDHAHVTMTFSKPAYDQLIVEYDGLPADPDHLQLCMNRN